MSGAAKPLKALASANTMSLLSAFSSSRTPVLSETHRALAVVGPRHALPGQHSQARALAPREATPRPAHGSLRFSWRVLCERWPVGVPQTTGSVGTGCRVTSRSEYRPRGGRCWSPRAWASRDLIQRSLRLSRSPTPTRARRRDSLDTGPTTRPLRSSKRLSGMDGSRWSPPLALSRLEAQRSISAVDEPA